MIAAVVVAGLNVLIPKLLGELIDVLARMGVLGGGGLRAVADNGAGDSTDFQLVSSEFLTKIKGPSIVLMGESTNGSWWLLVWLMVKQYRPTNKLLIQ